MLLQDDAEGLAALRRLMFRIDLQRVRKEALSRLWLGLIEGHFAHHMRPAEVLWAQPLCRSKEGHGIMRLLVLKQYLGQLEQSWHRFGLLLQERSQQDFRRLKVPAMPGLARRPQGDRQGVGNGVMQQLLQSSQCGSMSLQHSTHELGHDELVGVAPLAVGHQLGDGVV